jgi:hypothetical protein
MRDDAAMGGYDGDCVAYERRLAPQALIGCAAAIIGADGRASSRAQRASCSS